MSQFTRGGATTTMGSMAPPPIAEPELPALGGAMRMAPLAIVLRNVLERIYGELDGLVQQGPSLSDQDRCETWV